MQSTRWKKKGMNNQRKGGKTGNTGKQVGKCQGIKQKEECKVGIRTEEKKQREKRENAEMTYGE